MIKYNVGQVGAEVIHSHMNRLRVLKMTMENWDYNDGQKYSRGDDIMKLYEADLHKVNELTERGTKTMLEPDDDKEFLGTDKFLTKDEMLQMNKLFKYYGGKRG